jgi:hypothetical protein
MVLRSLVQKSKLIEMKNSNELEDKCDLVIDGKSQLF